MLRYRGCMRLRLPRRPAAVVAVTLLAFALWAGLLALQQRRAGQAFDFTRWEITTVANKWLYALGAPLRDDPPGDEALARYFALEDRSGAEGARLENAAEAEIEARIDAALRELDIRGPVSLPGPLPGPLLGPLRVFPPVDVELSSTPRVLVTSPRSRIELRDSDVLRPGIAAERLRELEREAEAADPALSALVLPLGGIATYPAIVSNRRDYAATVESAAHEWTHHYLAFSALGFAYFSSSDARVISETVADIAGDEIAALVLARGGDPAPGGDARPDASPAAPPDAAVDRDAVLRNLRLEVDALLADGRIDEAERRMEETRLELESAGVFIRRINQAYFAWFGTYAARADSVDPLGPQLFELRERAGTLSRFLELVRGVTSRAGVERLLAELDAQAAR